MGWIGFVNVACRMQHAITMVMLMLMVMVMIMMMSSAYWGHGIGYGIMTEHIVV